MNEIFHWQQGYNELKLQGNAVGVRITTTMAACVLPWEEVRGLVATLGQAWIENERRCGRMPTKR